MKKTIQIFLICFVFILGLNSFGLSYDSISGGDSPLRKKNANARDITRISFNIYEKNKSLGQPTYEGYVLFYDEFGTQCAVTSNNKPVIIWMGKGSEPVPSDRHKYDYYTELDVNTQNFQIFKIKSGETVIGLKIKPFTVNFKTKESEKKYAGIIPRFKMYWEVGNGKTWKKEVTPVYAY